MEEKSIKLEYLIKHWLGHFQVLKRSIVDQTKFTNVSNEDNNAGWPQNIQI